MSYEDTENALEGVAIIGMAGRFPGASDVSAFWRNLCEGIHSITSFTVEELQATGIDNALIENPDYVRARPILDNVDLFDAAFFGYKPREAELMDPQHRVFLECAWQALEQAGYAREHITGLVGVYAGLSLNTYLLSNLCANRRIIEELTQSYQVGSFNTLLGNDKDFLPTRVSYKLNLRGPSVNVQTACSTSLVAIAQACQSLLNYQCDIALAGGVSISFPQRRGYMSQDGGMISPDGKIRTFDNQANGTVFGEGVGVVTLKRLAEAVEDGDTVFAVIRGYAINNDGSSKVSYMAPSVDGQAEVIATAIGMAGIDADSISYIEAHGTGTPLGDPIEVAGLTRAFRMTTDRTGFCALGSAKTNVGHLDVAAGVAGVIKTALSLKNRVLPPSLHFETPNSRIDFASSPFYVNTRLTEWNGDTIPRRAGVSSFGVGGTNAHVVMEEAPLPLPVSPSRPRHLLLLSAKTATALDAMTDNLATHLRNTPDIDMADVCHTLHRGRQAFEHRRMLVCQNKEEAIAALSTKDAKQLLSGVRDQQEAPIVFLFPGQGAQQINMGRELYESETVFRDAIDRCCDILYPLLSLDLRRVLYPAAEEQEWAETQLLQTTVTQPALFVVEYALATLWMHWGIRPQAMIGHSLGEYTAACIAGVFTLEDALVLLAERARLMQSVPGGSMLAVRLPVAEVQPLLNEYLSLAAINGPSLCVVSGPNEAIQQLEAQLTEKRVAARRLNTSHAFHSAMMDPIIEAFVEKARQIPMRSPEIPYISNLTADWIRSEEATDPAYWGRHLREAVRFEEGARELLRDSSRLFLEVGPGQILSGLLRQQADRSLKARILASFDPERPELETTLTALGKLWMQGTAVNWEGFYQGQQRRRVPLPTYPFERKRYWVEPVPSQNSSNNAIGPMFNNHSNAKEIVQEKDSIALSSQQPISNESPATVVASTVTNGRYERIQGRLIQLMQEASGVMLDGVDVNASFVELGFDSLFMTQAAQLLQKEFKVRVTFRQLMGDLSNLEALTRHLDSMMPPDPPTVAPPQPVIAPPDISSNGHQAPVSAPIPTPIPAASLPVTPMPIAPVASLPAIPLAPVQGISAEGLTALERVAQQQLQTMSQLMALQLEAMRGAGNVSLPVSASPVSVPVPAAPVTPEKPQVGAAKPSPATTIGRFRPVTKGTVGELDARQQAYLDNLIDRYVRRTPESKRQTQMHRSYLADPRTVAGFRSQWKEMVYPIVFSQASGAHLQDIDGNDYLDFVNGFGVTMFGHSPSFVTEAVEAQIRKGVPIGPQSPLAGEVARRICELTGMERACFCNTGSEAVMAALRVCRTVTGREKVVVFAGGYHGTFDEVLVRPGQRNGGPAAMPIAPGIPSSMVENMVVLEYGTPESLAYIEANAGDLAAVLVESVQSRRPELQPREFLQEVRRITKAAETPLIFDEIVTGFRVHPGGVQALFGIRADLATYGKVIGGEYPIGILAGNSTYMDALDGGMWNYGDDSFPEVGMTFHAGTFMRHPQALAATLAILDHMKASGPSLQEKLNARGDRFATMLNACFERRNVPIKVGHFGSILHLSYDSDLKYAPLLYYVMRAKGIYLLEGFPIYLTTAHTDEDLEAAVRAFDQSIAELQQANLLPGQTDTTTISDMPSGDSDRITAMIATPKVLHPLEDNEMDDNGSAGPLVISMTEGQQGIWLTSQMGDNANCSFNEALCAHLKGPLDVESLTKALQQAVNRHEALRIVFSSDGEHQTILPEVRIELPVIDMPFPDGVYQEEKVNEFLRGEVYKPFDFGKVPLFRTKLLRFSPEHHLLLFMAHHVICDGWSFLVVLDDLAKFYSASVRDEVYLPEETPRFRDYVKKRLQLSQSGGNQPAEDYWLNRLKERQTSLTLPADQPRSPVSTYKGARSSSHLSVELLHGLKRTGARNGATLFITMLAAYSLLLSRITGQNDIIIGVPFAGQARDDNQNLVGNCVDLLPIRIVLDLNTEFKQLLAIVKEVIFDAYEYEECSLSRITERLALEGSGVSGPLISTTFNIDKFSSDIQFEGLQNQIVHCPRCFYQFDMGLNILEGEASLELEFDYRSDLFESQTIGKWADYFRVLLEEINGDAGQALKAIVQAADVAVPLPVAEMAEKKVLVRESSATSTASIAGTPQDDIETQLLKIWEEVLGVSQIGTHDNFFELGGYSLLALRLYGLIEKAFGVRLSLPTIFQSSTVAELAVILRERTGSTVRVQVRPDPILIPIQPQGNKTPLFLVHPDHGLVLFYQDLAKYFAPDRPVYGLQAAGLDGSEEPDSRIEDMAARYIREMLSVYPNGPFMIGGYSLGGAVAYEMAQQLRSQGHQVPILALFDAYAPLAYQQNLVDKPRIKRLVQHFHNLKEGSGKDKMGYFQNKVREFMKGKKPDWQIAADELKDSLSPERLELLRRAVMANERGFMDYMPKPYDGPVILFRATERSPFENDDPLLWWWDMFAGGVDFRDISGAHLTIMKEPRVQVVARELKQCIAQVGL